MNQPCYNSIALARHQHNLDRQEAKENFIAAEVDRLLCDNLWCIEMSKKFSKSWIADFDEYMKLMASQQANREYQQHLSALEQARIGGREGL